MTMMDKKLNCRVALVSDLIKELPDLELIFDKPYALVFEDDSALEYDTEDEAVDAFCMHKGHTANLNLNFDIPDNDHASHVMKGVIQRLSNMYGVIVEVKYEGTYGEEIAPDLEEN